jgi:branched-chain amino acid aminotransferase
MASTIQVDKAATSRIQEVDMNNLDFGRCFTDHMFEMQYANDAWKTAHVKPFGPIQITPALNVLHYGQAVFEGMKAFYVDEHQINLFRPDVHHARFNLSCRRMCIPETSFEVFIEALETLIRLDAAWVPQKRGHPPMPTISSCPRWAPIMPKDLIQFL